MITSSPTIFACDDPSLSEGRPNIRIGVVTDIHITHTPSDPTGPWKDWGDSLTFEKTLRYFNDQLVDVVVIAGDLTDNGLTEQLEAVASTWFRVFPNNRASDGRIVEKVFVGGNHDWEGFIYGRMGERAHPNESERAKHILRNDYEGHWRRIFHEEFAPIYKKNIKGYLFIGQHWMNEAEHQGENARCALLGGFMAELAELEKSRPFFYVQHPHPRNTCYGPWAWGHDDGSTTRILSRYPNAIVFSGHSHYPITDERFIWQGAFTSIAAGSLRYSCVPKEEYAKGVFSEELPKWEDRETTRCGLVISVYDTYLLLQRMDFCANKKLGSDLVMPLPAAESGPFDIQRRKSKSVPPEFRPGAELRMERAEVVDKDGKVHEVVRVHIPAALAGASRPYAYEVSVRGEDGGVCNKIYAASGYDRAFESEVVRAETVCTLPVEKLPRGRLLVFVAPIDCFQNKGSALEGRL